MNNTKCLHNSLYP